MFDMCEQLVPPRSVAVCTLTDTFSWRHESCYPVFGVYIDCKTVGFFLKISKEIGKAWRKSFTRAKRVRRLSPVSLFVFTLVPDLLFDCSRVLEYAKIRTVLQSSVYITLDNWPSQTISRSLFASP